MKKVIIVGGGIAGLTAGIYLQDAGFETVIHEKNAVPGGQCTGWKREGYVIDNCIHWMTGARPGSGLYDVWQKTGALGEGIALHEKPSFYASVLDGEKLTFWRDLERTRSDMLQLSPGDAAEINKLIDYTKMAETVTVPVDKPFDAMNLLDWIKLGASMKGMGKLIKAYGNMDLAALASRFQHPLIRQALVDYMPSQHLAYAFLISYATISSGNGDIPEGGSLAMALRIVRKYHSLGGVLHTNSPVKKVLVANHEATGVLLQDGREQSADCVICACDTDYTFRELLEAKYMPKSLRKLYSARPMYPVTSGFQVAFAVNGRFEALQGTQVFPCEKISIAESTFQRMSTYSYDYEASFAPLGKTVLQTNFMQTEQNFTYWKKLYEDRDVYHQVKQNLSGEIKERLLAQYPFLQGKVHVIDVWTPMTYVDYCNSYCGSYMSFIVTPGAKRITVPGKIKGIDNVFLASQWQMGPGGLPTAAAMGKFAAFRIAR